jgi:hypothetical protein
MSNGSNGAQLLVRHLEAEGVEYVLRATRRIVAIVPASLENRFWSSVEPPPKHVVGNAAGAAARAGQLARQR